MPSALAACVLFCCLLTMWWRSECCCRHNDAQGMRRICRINIHERDNEKAFDLWPSAFRPSGVFTKSLLRPPGVVITQINKHGPVDVCIMATVHTSTHKKPINRFLPKDAHAVRTRKLGNRFYCVNVS
jgi:hypothetical protein